jgi:DNA-binding FadR family transcriptional regulator
MPYPRWRQIAEDPRAKIEAGELASDGSPLPAELELRDQYDASRNTVRDAVKWLAMCGPAGHRRHASGHGEVPPIGIRYPRGTVPVNGH